MKTLIVRSLAVLFSIVPILAIWAAYTMISPEPAETAQVKFLGHREEKGCAKCHKPQYDSWKKTKHAKAMVSLEPGKQAGAKRKAKLDPDKDYTEDPDCVKCHVTGWEAGGYRVGKKRRMAKYYGVGCETCHGPGGDYQPVKDSYKNDDFPREEIIATGMLYAELETCIVCHNTDEDNPFPEPYFETDTYDDGLLESHDHVKQKKHAPREGSEWLYEE